jgi:hypothetical protein
MVSSTVKLMSQMRIQWYRKRDASVSPTKFSLGCQYNWCLPKSRGNIVEATDSKYSGKPVLETYRILLSERIVAFKELESYMEMAKVARFINFNPISIFDSHVTMHSKIKLDRAASCNSFTIV